jgi:tetratricopeptide (TPR) repeat protein
VTTKTRRATKKSLHEKLDAQLVQLEAAQLIRRAGKDEPVGEFRHALTQDAAYDSLLKNQRRELHQLVAASYEELYADHLDDYSALLAQHYAQAGDDARTFTYSVRAGDAAAHIYANAEAVVHYTRALQVAQRGGEPGASKLLQELYSKRGRALELLSHFSEASTNYDEMYALAHERGDRAFELTALIACAQIRAIPGSARDETQGRALSEQALDLARELGDRAAESKILWILLLISIYTGGDAHQALQYGEQSLAIARELNLLDQMAYTLHDLFVAHTYLGEMDQARAVRAEASGIWRKLGNKPMLAESLSGLALISFLRGEFDQALSLAEEGFQISSSIANVGGQGFSGYTLGLIYNERGETKLAFKSVEDAIAIIQFGGLEGNGLSPYGMLGAIHADLGDLGQASDYVHRALERPSSRLFFQRMWLAALQTRVELLCGNLSAAEAAFRDGKVDASIENYSRLFPPGAPILYIAAAELALARQEYDQAIELVDALLARLRFARTRVAIPEALYVKAQALRGLQRIDQVRAALTEAHAEAQAIGVRRKLWQILALLGEIEAASGNQVEAQAARAQAREVIEYIAAHAPTDLSKSFLNSREVRAVLELEQSI